MKNLASEIHDYRLFLNSTVRNHHNPMASFSAETRMGVIAKGLQQVLDQYTTIE